MGAVPLPLKKVHEAAVAVVAIDLWYQINADGLIELIARQQLLMLLFYQVGVMMIPSSLRLPVWRDLLHSQLRPRHSLQRYQLQH